MPVVSAVTVLVLVLLGPAVGGVELLIIVAAASVAVGVIVYRSNRHSATA